MGANKVVRNSKGLSQSENIELSTIPTEKHRASLKLLLFGQFCRGFSEVQKSKEAKMKAAMAGGKSRKKKWAKGKVKEKLANLVMFDKALKSLFWMFHGRGHVRQDVEGDPEGSFLDCGGGFRCL